MEDDEILKLLQDEKTVQRGFSMLVDQYSERLYWQVRRLVFNHDDANDIIQNVFTKAWINMGRFEGKSKLFTWLTRIAINESLDFLRKKAQRSDIDMDDNPVVENQLVADEYFDGDAIQQQLQKAINTLPEVQKAVFTLRYFEEMKYSDMSKVLQTSEGALKASYHLAVKKIEAYFNKRD